MRDRFNGKNSISQGRMLLFAAGVFLVGSGVGMITQAGLGTSATTSFAYVLSFIFPPSLGTFAFLVNLCMVLAQAVILYTHENLRSAKEWIRLVLQVPAALLFSSSIDLIRFVLRHIPLHAYWQQILFLLLGIIVFGAGVAMEVTADVIVLPAEAVIKVISETWNHDFGTVKTIFDMTLCAAAILISLLYFGEIRGVREGTVITALIAGSTARFFLKLLKHKGAEPSG